MVHKDITIIILLFNTPSNVLKNLRNYKNFKVAILDQSNDFDSKKKIKKFLPNVIYYKVSENNIGFSNGVNFLVNKVNTKYFLCTQPDVYISVKSILELKKVFLNNNDAIISVPKFKKIKTKKKLYGFKKIQNFVGSIFLCEKRKFKKIKMFDRNFFFYWEDVDLSKRIEKSRYQIYLSHKSIASHQSSKSTKKDLISTYIRTSNFKFGEYLYQYKNDRLKLVKILREPFINCFLFFLNIVILKKKNAIDHLFTLIGLLKFYKYVFLKKLK